MTRPTLALVAQTNDTSSARLLTPREVAEILRVSPSMVRALTRRDELRAAYIGRLPRYRTEDVTAYLDRALGRGQG
jgi:excisionase family DNA binding protein